MSTWKRDFASGLVVVAPILVILFVANWLYSALATLPFVPRIGPPEGQTPSIPPSSLFAPVAEYVEPLLPALYRFAEVFVALVVFVLIVFSAGYLMRTTSGRLVEGFLDDMINRVPGLRVIYNASKLAVETALTGTEDLQTPVKLEPWDGMRMTAFKTGQTTSDGREVVFMPTAPNITTGFVMEVEPADLDETDEKVEEALTRILSAGFGEGGNGEAPPGQTPVDEIGRTPGDD
ncbi:DUF502 domain-containing protein [Halobaculum litoreum]|uniref:DUF502 domain-containing protein n=1 Tax=Halobaculum litoreum TaxID=3031998 RepID=A0ABD5XMH5_9EURY|nr:DUF502 domain-containing protein [Halobaculum sp. DT92]